MVNHPFCNKESNCKLIILHLGTERCKTFYRFCYPDLAKKIDGVNSYSACEEKCEPKNGTKLCYLEWNDKDETCLIDYDVKLKCKRREWKDPNDPKQGYEDWKWEFSIAHEDCGTGAIIFAIVLVVLLVAAMAYILYWCKNLEV